MLLHSDIIISLYDEVVISLHREVIFSLYHGVVISLYDEVVISSYDGVVISLHYHYTSGRGTAVEDYTPAKFRVISSPYLASANEISVNSLIDVVIDASKGSLYKTNLDPTTGICYNVVTKVTVTLT